METGQDIGGSVLLVLGVLAAAVVLVWHAVAAVLWLREKVRPRKVKLPERDGVARSLEALARDEWTHETKRQERRKGT